MKKSFNQQESWEDINEEKKDVEKPAEVPKAKPKPKKTLAEKIEEREVCINTVKFLYVSVRECE